MEYFQGITVPTKTGNHRISYSDSQLSQIQHDHGKNTYNVVFLISCWTSLLADSPISPNRRPKRSFNQFYKSLVDDLFGTIRLFSSISDEFCASIIRTEEGVSITHFIGAFKDTPIIKEYLYWLETKDASTLCFILSFLSFGSKLYYDNPELDDTALREWHIVEERLRSLEPPHPLLKGLRAVMRAIFKGWAFGPFLPKHGSGRVAEQGLWGSNLKNAAFPMSPRIRYLYLREMWCDGTYPRFLPESEGPLVWDVSRDASKVKFVPKNWKKTRSICMEPLLYQWAQQGVRLWYERHLNRSILRRYVTIQDQGANQDGAQFGSEQGQVDTIDLSAASDSIAWKVVKSIFPPGVLKHLAATRTSKVELPDGSIFAVAKFAPMGSALCFPVQSTIFASVIILVYILHAHGLTLEDAGSVCDLDISRELAEITFDEYTYENNLLQPFKVYGDDIICDSRTTSVIIAALHQLGFLVNEGKSFVGEQAYRESCGKHYCDEQDVTPYYLKLKEIGSKVTIASMVGVIDAANRAREYDYTHLRRHILRFIMYYPILNVKKRMGRNPILFTRDSDQSFAVVCDSPRNTTLDTRFYTRGMTLPPDTEVGVDTHIQYQRDEVKSIAVAPERIVETMDRFDNYHYVLWQRSRVGERKSVSFETARRCDAIGNRVTWRWTPRQ